MSGAGKTTLLRWVRPILETPTSGSITLDGTDLASLSGTRLIETRRKMGVVFQGYNLLMQRTVHQNIAFPRGARHAAKHHRPARWATS